MVHKPERIADIIDILRKNKLEPKELRFVYSNKDLDATLVLVKAVKGGNKFVHLLEVVGKDVPLLLLPLRIEGF